MNCFGSDSNARHESQIVGIVKAAAVAWSDLDRSSGLLRIIRKNLLKHIDKTTECEFLRFQVAPPRGMFCQKIMFDLALDVPNAYWILSKHYFFEICVSSEVLLVFVGHDSGLSLFPPFFSGCPKHQPACLNVFPTFFLGLPRASVHMSERVSIFFSRAAQNISLHV